MQVIGLLPLLYYIASLLEISSMTMPVNLASEEKNQTFHRHLHLYRALAIILIVAAHSWALAIFYYTPDFSLAPRLVLLSSVTETLFHDGTIIFALISGLLFSLVLKGRGWKRFYGSKFNYVLLPYIVMTFVYTLIHWKLIWVGYFEIEPDTLQGYLLTALHNIPLGLGGFHLWYIPVLLVLYLVTPLINLIVSRQYYVLIGVIILAPLIASRVWPQFSWLTVVYFLGPYTIGVIIGAHYDKALQFIQQHSTSLFIVFFFTTGFSVFFYEIGFEYLGFVSIRESIFYLQKLAMAALLLVAIFHMEKNIPTWVDKIGNYSFALYFIHPALAILAVEFLKKQGLLSDNPWYVIVLGALVLIYVISASMLISVLIKKLTGKYSRMLIGA
jgi:surface polysaccharide O-acyltransferase-like enzyme